MTRGRLVISDIFCVMLVGIIWLVSNGFHTKAVVVFIILASFALKACINRHVDYFKLTKKIY